MASLGLADLTSRTTKMAKKKIFKKDKDGAKKSPFGKSEDKADAAPKKKGAPMYDHPRSMKE